MSEIQRYTIDRPTASPTPVPQGWLVLFDDHVTIVTRLESRLAAAEALRNAIEKYLGPEVGGSTGPATPHWLDMVNAIAAFDAAKDAKR